jgi:hypothetical protein
MTGSVGSSMSRSSPSETLLNYKPDQASSSSSAAVASELTQIKIRLRGEAEKRKSTAIPADHPHKVRKLTAGTSTGLNGSDGDENHRRDIFGRDDVTVRFLWEEETVTDS